MKIENGMSEHLVPLIDIKYGETFCFPEQKDVIYIKSFTEEEIIRLSDGRISMVTTDLEDDLVIPLEAKVIIEGYKKR